MKKLSFNPKPLKGLLMLLTILFVMPQSALAQTKYKIETDGNCEVYYYEWLTPVVVTEAAEGKVLSVRVNQSANPGDGKYFTGEFTMNGKSLGTTESGFVEGFTMPAEAVMIKALQADKQTLSVDLTTTTRQEVPPAAALLFNGDGRLNYNDKLGGYDVDKSGVADMVYTTSEDGKHMYVQRLAGADAMGTYTLDYSSWNTTMYGSISFVFSHTAKTVLASWISLSAESFTYTGQAIEPQVTVTDCGTDVTEYFDVTYQNNVLAGESTDAQAPTVTVKAKDTQTGYLGSAQQTFTIEPRVTTGGSRIAVIADPHVMPASLLTDASNTDWTTYLAGSRKLVDYSQTLFDQTVATLKSDKPELVLIVGDLTKDGELASHNYLKGKLDELKAAGIPTLVIPGNHDLGSSDAKIYGATTTAAPTISQSDFAQLYQDYGYGTKSERESTSSLTYVCEPITGLVVIGIDSGEEGQLSESTLTWVCNKAIAARAAGKQVIAMMHHPLIPHITGGEAFVSTVSVADYATVRNRLADAGISVVFTGHFHTSDIAKDWNGDKSLPIYDVTTGSLCSYPCDYRVVTLNDALTQMEIDTRSITSAGAPLGGGDNFTTAIAKTRLTTSMTNILTPRLTAKLVEAGNSQTVASIFASGVAPNLAQAYIYHAEGDEHNNSAAQSLLTGLNQLLGDHPSYKTMANSILEDKSNYGTDRADQTNDRSLSVSIERTAKAIMTTAKIKINKPEQLKKGDTFDAAIGQTETAPQEVSTNYALCILDGVWVNATVTAELESLTEGKATYTVTGNKASKLSFESVKWKDNGALMDHSKTLNNIDFSGAAVETSNINFTNIESLDAGKKMTLVADFGDAVGTITGSKYIIGTTLEGAGEASLDGNNLIFTIETATAQAQTHNTVMAADISCATLSFGDCHVGAAQDGLSLASNTGADGVATFAQMGGGSMRQETGARAMVRGGKVLRPYFNLSYSGARIMCKAADVALQAAEEAQGKVRGVAEQDITIESGKTYDILTDEDLTLTLKLSEGDILITAITLKYPDPNDLNLDGEVNVADIVKAIADGKSQAEIDAIVNQIME